MAEFVFSRWIAPVLLAAGLGIAAMTPGIARADDDLVRVLVNVADIVYHSGQPYYRHGDYGRYDRVVVVRDRYRRPTYYRYVPRDYYVDYRPGPPYGRAHGYYRKHPRYYYRDSDPRYYGYRDGHDRYDRWDDDDNDRGHGRSHRDRDDD
jgi:hypothetical protein